MADNINVLDAASATKTMRTTDNAGVHTAHHIVESSALPTGAATETTLAAIDTKTVVYTEDDAAAANPTGPMTMAVRSDSAATVGADGDNVAIRANQYGSVYTNIDLLGSPDGGTFSNPLYVEFSGSTSAAVRGAIAHDAAAGSTAPVLAGGYAFAAAPGDVTLDGDAVRAWYLRNGAQATVLTAAGALIPGDATNGLDVDVTRLPASTSGGPANVASSATSVTLLASNASRKGASIMNDSTEVLYVKFGATASATSFHVKMAAGSYLEVPFGYTGIIDGIWASANGSARVGEFT